jgi:hypothetical protein
LQMLHQRHISPRSPNEAKPNTSFHMPIHRYKVAHRPHSIKVWRQLKRR